MEIDDVAGHDSALYGYTRSGTTSADEVNFVMNHARGAGSISIPVDLQSSATIVLRLLLTRLL